MTKQIISLGDKCIQSSNVEHEKHLLSDILTNQGTIIETVTNANGTAMKFSNGFMVAYGKKTYTLSNTDKVGNLYYGGVDLNLYYPVPFIELPIVNLQFQGCYTIYEVVWGFSVNGLGHIYYGNATSRTNQSNTLHYIAYGRWK